MSSNLNHNHNYNQKENKDNQIRKIKLNKFVKVLECPFDSAEKLKTSKNVKKEKNIFEKLKFLEDNLKDINNINTNPNQINSISISNNIKTYNFNIININNKKENYIDKRDSIVKQKPSPFFKLNSFCCF